MNVKIRFAGSILAFLIGVTNCGNLLAAHGGGGGGGGGMGGGSHGGMGGSFSGSMGGGFHGGMGGSFHGGTGSSFHSFSSPGFSSGMRSNAYTASRGNSFMSNAPARSFQGNFHTPSFGNNEAFRGNNFSGRDLGRGNDHFQPGMKNPVNPQTWSHNNNWWQNNFARGHDHDHDFDHFNHFNHFNSFAFFPYWWNYSPFYAWYGYPYSYDYYYGYPYDEYYGYYQPDIYSSSINVEPSEYASNIDENSVGSEATDDSNVDWGGRYINSARDAFRSGDYSDALRLANHAVVEMPRNAHAHELMSLALFALKDYRGANIEAHAALSLGPPSDWSTLYGYYGDLPTYTKQLDALVEYIHSNKDATDARFVLAYQNLMMGHKEVAKNQLEDVVAKVSKDQVAQRLLKDLGGSVTASTDKSDSEAPKMGNRATTLEK